MAMKVVFMLKFQRMVLGNKSQRVDNLLKTKYWDGQIIQKEKAALVYNAAFSFLRNMPYKGQLPNPALLNFSIIRPSPPTLELPLISIFRSF